MGEMVNFATKDGMGRAYRAIPKEGRGPGVIVLQEQWGLVGHITSIVDRLSDHGYVAIAPDIYHGATASTPDSARRLAENLSPDTAAEDISASVRHLGDLDECTGRIGAVGFCLGGSLALWSAALRSEVQAAVGFYPLVPWDQLNPQWANFSDKAAVIHQSGENAAQRAASAKAAIEAAGGQCSIYDYPGTKHAFFNDDRTEAYDEKASASAWARTLECFRSTLS